MEEDRKIGARVNASGRRQMDRNQNTSAVGDISGDARHRETLDIRIGTHNSTQELQDQGPELSSVKNNPSRGYFRRRRCCAENPHSGGVLGVDLGPAPAMADFKVDSVTA